MRNKLSKGFLFLLLFFPFFSFSQYAFIPQAGLTFSRLNSDPEGLKSSARIGYQFGISVRTGGRFYFQPAVNWFRSGMELKTKEEIGSLSNLDDQVDMYGVYVPALLGFKLVDEELFKLRFFAGPAGRLVTKVDESDFPFNKDDFSELIWSMNTGLGIDFLFMTFDICYDVGITDVFENQSGVRNNALILNFGIKLQ